MNKIKVILHYYMTLKFKAPVCTGGGVFKRVSLLLMSFTKYVGNVFRLSSIEFSEKMREKKEVSGKKSFFLV